MLQKGRDFACQCRDPLVFGIRGFQAESAITQNIAATRVADSELDQSQQTNRSLAILSVANLGFGVGIGGILGIIFMIAYARFGSRRSE